MEKFFNYYVEKCKKLKRCISGDGPAPHKPILMLSVITSIERGIIITNSFIVKELSPIFNELWTSLVITKHSCNISTPFSHLETDGFWHISRNGSILHANLDSEFFRYLQLQKSRHILIRVLLEEYFWNNKNAWKELFPDLFAQEEQIVNSCLAEENVGDDSKAQDNNPYLNMPFNKVKENATHGAILAEKVLPRKISILRKKDEDTQLVASAKNASLKRNISSLNLPALCLRALSTNLKIQTVGDFCKADLTPLETVPGIGERKIFNLHKLQFFLQKEKKCFPHSNSAFAVAALREFGIQTISSFCKADLSKLSSIPRMNKEEIKFLKIEQRTLQDRYDIYPTRKGKTQFLKQGQKLPQDKYDIHPQNKFIPEDLERNPSKRGRKKKESKESFSPAYGIAEEFVLTSALGTFFDYDDNNPLTIGELGLSHQTRCFLFAISIFEFDTVPILFSTTVEYFLIHLGEQLFSELWSALTDRFILTEKHYHLNNRFMDWKALSVYPFPEDLITDKQLNFLHNYKIYTWGNLKEYSDAGHQINLEFLLFARFYSQIFLKYKAFQDALNHMPKGTAISACFDIPDKRAIEIYEKRIREKNSLEDISKIFNITRERVRQITKVLDSQAEVKRTYLNPSTSYFDTLYIFINSIFSKYNGVISEEILENSLLPYFDWDTESIQFIRHFIELNFKVNQDGEYIYYPNSKCLKCQGLYDHLVKNIKEKNIIENSDLVLLKRSVCNECIYCTTKESSETESGFFNIYSKLNLKEFAVYVEDDSTLYSVTEYSIIKGTRKDALNVLFKRYGILTFEQVFDELRKYRPDLTKRTVYGYISCEDLVLADRGKYMLKENLPKLPEDLLHKILDDIAKRFRRNPNMMFNVSLLYNANKKTLEKARITSAYMLYEVLKETTLDGIRFIKCPYITISNNTSRFSISEILEGYVEENGKIPLEEARNFLCHEMGIEPYVFSMAYHGSDELIVDDDNHLLRLDQLNIKKKDCSAIVETLESLVTDHATTAHKLFSLTSVNCAMTNITGPKMLFNILRQMYADRFSFKYPQIAKETSDIQNIKKLLVDFIRAQKTFCTVDELIGFCNKLHFSYKNIYLKSSEIYLYLPGTWIHKETLGWIPEYAERVITLAEKHLCESSTPEGSYSFLPDLTEEESLPVLANDIFWTPTLIGNVLEESGKFIIYGKNKMFFSSIVHKRAFESFGDLCSLLLDTDFGGGANLDEFSKYLREKNLIANKLTDSIIGGSKRIKIDGMEIYTTGAE